MTKALFIVGARVRAVSRHAPLAKEGAYTVVRILPIEDGQSVQYRIKGDAEAFERVVRQEHLEAIHNAQV